MPPPPPARLPLVLTHVAYRADEPIIGPVAAILTLLPLAGLVVMATWLAARRELRTAWALLGAVLNAAMCDALKRRFDEPRPLDAILRDAGMPSNHAATMAFLSLWPALAASGQLARASRAAAAAAAMLATAAVAWSRVHLGEHTPAQCWAGALLGGASCGLWHALWLRAARRALLPILEWRVCCALCVRDSSCVRSVVRAEYEMVRRMAQDSRKES